MQILYNKNYSRTTFGLAYCVDKINDLSLNKKIGKGWSFALMPFEGNLIQGMAQVALKNWKNLFWRPKGRQQNKFRSVLFTIMKTNCSILLSHLPFGLQSCFQAIWFFPMYNISLPFVLEFQSFFLPLPSIGSMMTSCLLSLA